MKRITLLSIFIFFVSASIFGHTSTDQHRTITIWVHGTKLTPTIVFKKFFYRILGMQPALVYDKKYHKRTIAELLSKISPEHYQLEDFYFFGWSGKLCFDERRQVAQELYEDICRLIDQYEEQDGIIPLIRIITHSHGGNLVLNLANVQDAEKPIYIDELILLACPVQDKTKDLITHDCFNKVYAFYSGSDMFQIIDPQGLYKQGEANNTFSRRTFDYHEKLRQACIKINGKSLMHIDFIWQRFLKHLPDLCVTIDQFYASIISSQIAHHKILDIRTKKGNTYIRKKFL